MKARPEDKSSIVVTYRRAIRVLLCKLEVTVRLSSLD